jgi:hypothetical protein
VDQRLSGAFLRDLATAVDQRGLGLLLAGGRSLLNDRSYAETALQRVSPTSWVVDQFGLSGPLSVQLTDRARRHPLLTDLAATGVLGDQVFEQLPPLGGAALLGEPKTLATVLLVDESGRPILVTQEFGRGRSAVAAWESTWQWALASDTGARLHQQFWRQLILWLANRRPRAWVLADAAIYTRSALRSGEQQVHLRAGVTGTDRPGAQAIARADAELVLVRGDERRTIPLRREGREWRATLSPELVSTALREPGAYQVEFSVAGVGNDRRARPPATAPTTRAATEERLTAGTGFFVDDTALERQAPTANLPLLQAMVDAAGARAKFVTLAELPAVLRQLNATDRREIVRERVQYRTVQREPWALVWTLALVLTLEWALRKRLGLI